MPTSDEDDDIQQEIARIRRQLKKLSRRRRRNRSDSRHRFRRSTSRSRSRNRSRSRRFTQAATGSDGDDGEQLTTASQLLLPPPSPPTEQREQENVDPATIIGENRGEAPIPDALLIALGDEKPTEERYGPQINNLIGSRWENIILNDSEEIKDILKNYKIPKNCPLLEAPELNPEVKAALTDSARNRDQMLQTKQQQLGIALACLGQAMTEILAGHEISDALRMLSDGTKLLTSLHHKESNTRKQLLAPLLDKSFTKMAESIPRNQYLFGENLAEKIKNSKEIEKSGLQLRKPKSSTFNRPGNWAGPSRRNTQQKNTMRGGQKRPPVQPQTKKTYQPPNRPSKRAPAYRPERDYQRARHRR